MRSFLARTYLYGKSPVRDRLGTLALLPQARDTLSPPPETAGSSGHRRRRWLPRGVRGTGHNLLMADRTEELRTAERRLQAAQRTGDVEELDRLLDDRLFYTG